MPVVAGGLFKPYSPNTPVWTLCHVFSPKDCCKLKGNAMEPWDNSLL